MPSLRRPPLKANNTAMPSCENGKRTRLPRQQDRSGPFLVAHGPVDHVSGDQTGTKQVSSTHHLSGPVHGYSKCPAVSLGLSVAWKTGSKTELHGIRRHHCVFSDQCSPQMLTRPTQQDSPPLGEEPNASRSFVLFTRNRRSGTRRQGVVSHLSNGSGKVLEEIGIFRSCRALHCTGLCAQRCTGRWVEGQRCWETRLEVWNDVETTRPRESNGCNMGATNWSIL